MNMVKEVIVSEVERLKDINDFIFFFNIFISH